MQTVKRVVIAMVLVLVPLLASAARAQDDGQWEEARSVFTEAQEEFDRSNFALSLHGFQRAYDLMEGHERRALVLFNVARCYEELGRRQDAIRAFRRYLAEAGRGAERRMETERRIQELEARARLDGQADAEDGSSEGGPSEGSATGSGEIDEGGVSPIGPIVLGAGGAMILAGVITGALALSARSDVTALCTGMVCPGSARGRADEVNGLAATTDVLLFGGTAVAVAGLLLTLLLHESGADDAQARLSCGAVGCVAAISGVIR